MTLDEAWQWYRTTWTLVGLVGRLGEKHWDALPWDGPLGKDDKLKELRADTIIDGSALSLEPLDDFAILILFSVFESTVRDHVISDIQGERDRSRHDLAIDILDGAIETIGQGSFYRVLDVFKGMDAALVEEVNQVRRYRNWVAHGRRTTRPNAVDPPTAYNRLKRFLDVMTER